MRVTDDCRKTGRLLSPPRRQCLCCRESGGAPGTCFATTPGEPEQPGVMREQSGEIMLDRQKIEAVLRRRFSGATDQQIATAANAIMGLDDEWEEVSDASREFGYHDAAECREICYLAREFDRGSEFRVWRRVSPPE
jgi:hypothetical protein